MIFARPIVFQFKLNGWMPQGEVLPLSPILFFSPASIRDIFPAFCLRSDGAEGEERGKWHVASIQGTGECGKQSYRPVVQLVSEVTSRS